jgi:16S rRNA (guanine966-N2)-methyltransferase
LPVRATRNNFVRIIGGKWRSRIIRFPDSAELRPTPDRVRETLFNWLGQDLTGKSCLDLFAGSGALGFEALSRGASSVTMVERSPAVCRALQESAARLGAEALTIQCGDALEFLVRAPANAGSFDVIFLDPPFLKGLPQELWLRLPARLTEQGLVYLEAESEFDDASLSGFAVIRKQKAGNVHYHLIRRNEQ